MLFFFLNLTLLGQKTNTHVEDLGVFCLKHIYLTWILLRDTAHSEPCGPLIRAGRVLNSVPKEKLPQCATERKAKTLHQLRQRKKETSLLWNQPVSARSSLSMSYIKHHKCKCNQALLTLCHLLKGRAQLQKTSFDSRLDGSSCFHTESAGSPATTQSSNYVQSSSPAFVSRNSRGGGGGGVVKWDLVAGWGGGWGVRATFTITSPWHVAIRESGEHQNV